MNRATFLKLVGVAILGRNVLPTPEAKPFPITREMIEDEAYKPALTATETVRLYDFRMASNIEIPSLKRYQDEVFKMMGGLK